jgi:glycosyltransferase involved in cell wall biosynthesis
VPLVLGGRVFPYPEHERYFEREIAPRLGPHCRFAGPLDLRRKRRLLAAARCLLVPSVAPESSSLVAMEALASGTPVIAYSNGALADIVEPGRTGFLVRDAAEMARAIGEVAAISPHACARAAAARFSAERMAARYLDLYRLLVARRFDGARDEDPDILRAAPNV